MTTGPPRSGGLKFNIRRVKNHINFFGFGHHGHRGRGGVHPALGFGGWDPLNTVNTGFELQCPKDLVTANTINDFFVSAKRTLAGILQFHLPTLFFAVALVHTGQVPRKKPGLVASGSRSDFEKDILVIFGIPRNEKPSELFFQTW